LDYRRLEEIIARASQEVANAILCMGRPDSDHHRTDSDLGSQPGIDHGCAKTTSLALTPRRFFRGAPGHQQMIQNFSAPRNKSSAGFFRCSFPKVRRNVFPVAPGDAIFAPEREQATPRRGANRRLICVQDNKTVPNSRRGRGSRWEWRLVERRTVAHQDKLRRLKETVNAACDSFFRRRGLPGKRHW
jgi:hypothetical protein